MSEILTNYTIVIVSTIQIMLILQELKDNSTQSTPKYLQCSTANTKQIVKCNHSVTFTASNDYYMGIDIKWVYDYTFC